MALGLICEVLKPVRARMYENKEIQEECNPVNVYKLYRDKRPGSMMEPARRSIFLTVNHFKTSVQGQTWFKAQAMGVN